MNYGELKAHIRDLGFEEDSSMQEYESVVRNACNRSINLILKTIVQPYDFYFKRKFEYDEEGNRILDDEGNPVKWVEPTPQDIQTDTPDSFKIDLPDKLIDILPLLCSYFVWLDDDERKAVYYYNLFDDFKVQLLADINKPRGIIVGGYRF